ncbi:uncharacterized protein LOC118735840 [Rhagoletis pomonella]|uniref:uncharacterized protein LOC118735840 n=1 Tax=Rhagoletis pomonella TaxID=28610 RepID=UPI0017810E50|nr:uncharacterized protein LOC118735840 [Rhagoletis pomonella]
MKRLLWLALTTIFLTKLALAVPTPTTLNFSASTESNEIERSTATPTNSTQTAVTKSGHTNNRKGIVIMVFKKYTNLLTFQLERSHQIAKDLLSDPTIVGVNNEEMQKATNMLLDYVAQSDISELAKLPPAEIPNRYYLAIGTMFVIGKFDAFVRQLNTTSEQDRTPTARLLWTALQRHGYQEFQVEVEKRYIELLETIVDDVGEYVTSLSPANREKDKQLVQAYDMYVKHPERYTKIEFGGSLFDVFFKEAAKAYE